jgi:septum formation inhibitor MinC
MHRRTDSDVSVQGLATMFESLEVKDPREVAQRYKQMLEKEKAKWVEKLNKHDRDHAMILERKAVRIEELESELAQAKSNLQIGVSREQYEKEWKANKANIKKWEQVFKEREDQWKADHHKVVSCRACSLPCLRLIRPLGPSTGRPRHVER